MGTRCPGDNRTHLVRVAIMEVGGDVYHGHGCTSMPGCAGQRAVDDDRIPSDEGPVAGDHCPA
jgi:hypothetical protein